MSIRKILLSFLMVFFIAGATYFLRSSEKRRDLNIILITVDALRADHLGCYGYRRNTSPNIDGMARKGVLFTQAIAQASRTPSSIAGIATSTYPPTNQLRDWGEALKPGIPTIGKILKNHGYKTIFVGANPAFRDGLHGLDMGFDTFYVEDGSASVLTQKASELMEGGNSKPFFLWIHYMNVHDYSPTPEFKNLYIDDKFYDKKNKLPFVKPTLTDYGFHGIPDWLATRKGRNDNPDYYIALYDGAIRFVDEQVGLLLRSLKHTNNGRKTVVILTADHGELLGEHGYYFHHGSFLYEPLLKVPLILYGIDNISDKRHGEQVSAGLDILPTILSLLRIKNPKTVQGIDLMSMLKKNGKNAPLFAVSDIERAICLRSNEWKLIFRPADDGQLESYELFHIKDDPGETSNLVSVEKNELSFLKKKLKEYREKFPVAEKSAPALDEETRRKLRSLGYLQ